MLIFENNQHCALLFEICSLFFTRSRQTLARYAIVLDSSILRPLSRIFHKIRLAETFFRLISSLAEFLRKLLYSVKNTAEHQKFCYQDRQIKKIKI